MPRLRSTGSALVVLGGVLFLGALALLPFFSVPYAGIFGGEPTLWDLSTREPLILTIVALAAIVSAAGGLLSEEVVLLALASAASFYLFGRVFPLGSRSYSAFGAGFWVCVSAAFAMSLGGVLALVAARLAPRSAESS